MRHLINCYGNITKSRRYSCTDLKHAKYVNEQRTYFKSRHINLKQNFVYTLVEEKLAIFRHKTSEHQLLECLKNMWISTVSCMYERLLEFMMNSKILTVT